MKNAKCHLDLISVDDVILDEVVDIPDFPRSEKVVLAESIRKEVGGACNFMIAAKRFGIKVGGVGCVGMDENGQFIKETLKKEGVDTTYIFREEGATKRTLTLVNKRGEKSFLGLLGKGVALLEPAHIQKGIFEHTKALYFSGYSLARIPTKWESEAVFKAFQLSRDWGVRIFFDPSPLVPLIPKNVLGEIINSSEVLFLNKEEARFVTGLNELRAAATTLLKIGAQRVVIKLGERGSLISSVKKTIKVGGFKVKVLDPTGAGDVFNAAFLHGLFHDFSDRECLILANAAGAITTTKLGAGRCVPNLQDVKSFLSARDYKFSS